MVDKGTYLLIMWLEAPIVQLAIGRLGCQNFATGYYLYVGSAFGSGGLPARLHRHKQREKARPHWHIDYLRPHTHLCEIWSVASEQRLEELWSKALADAYTQPIRGFGSSDSSCYAHLFYTARQPTIKELSHTLFTIMDTSLEAAYGMHITIELCTDCLACIRC